MLIVAGVAAGFLIMTALLVGSDILVRQAFLSLGPKNTITFVPAVGPEIPIAASDLEETARILTERAEALKYRRVTFRVSGNDRIVAEIPANIDIPELADRIGSIGLLEFVDFGSTPVPEGEIVRTDIDHRFLPVGEGTRWHTVMTNSAMESVSVTMDEFDRYAVEFTLTEEGTRIFAGHTRDHIGTYLGIVMDKVVLSVPVIQSEISGGTGRITGNFTAESAAALAASLSTTPLPIPVRISD
jgi:preprotein translocase subunit SecD